jgi:beta-catenin-like protein 1
MTLQSMAKLCSISLTEFMLFLGRFIDSEADLDSALKALLPLAQVPALACPELVKSGTITHLIGLLAHENVDIAIDVVEVLKELTDEDVGNEADEYDEEEATKEDGLKILLDSLVSLVLATLTDRHSYGYSQLENSALELLVSNMTRFNEAEESDRQGIYYTLGIFENVIGLNPSLARTLVANTSVLKWLLERAAAKKHDENRGYASELIAILLQSDRLNRLEFGKLGGVETSLQILSVRSLV